MAAPKKDLHELDESGEAASRVDVVILPQFDAIAWREQKTGPVLEQRASTRYWEVADHEDEEDPRKVSIPAHEFDRLAKLGAVAKPGTKAEKEAVKAEEERQEAEAQSATPVPEGTPVQQAG